MTILLLLVTLAAIAWGTGQRAALKAAQAQLQELLRRYKPAMDIDQYVLQVKERVQKLLDQEGRIRAEIESAEQGLARINKELELASDAAFLVDVGYYEPRYEFEDLPSYEAELQRIRDKQKAMLREDGTGSNSQRRRARTAAAAYATKSLTFNDSASQGRALQKTTLKLILRAFNGESDSFIARVNYRNVDAMEKRIRSAFDAINALTQKYNFCELNPLYMSLRLQEL